MAKPGPAKGSGGAPRKAVTKPNVAGGGYSRVTVGPAGKGTTVYKHRAVAYGGVPPKSSKGATTGIVDHKNRQRGSNGKSNLRITTRSVNNANKGK